MGLSLVLIPAFGIVGAAFAILVNSLVLVPVFIVYVHRAVLGLGVGELVRRSLVRPLGAAAVSWVPMLLLAEASDSVGLLVVGIAAGLAAFAAATFAFSVYDAVDRDVARSYFRRVASGGAS